MTRSEAKARIEELAARDPRARAPLPRARQADHLGRQYDRMFKDLSALEEQFPDLRASDSPTQRIGAPPRAGFKKVRHVHPLLSLDSLMEESEVREFDERVRKGLRSDEGLFAEPVAYMASPNSTGSRSSWCTRTGSWRAARPAATARPART
jgi:DNA ligase (NAD+)